MPSKKDTNKKDPKEKETIETTAIENNENNQEESIMNENVNNNNTQAQQENVQATETQQAPVKEKKHMPNWLKYTIAGVMGIGAGIGGTLAAQHFKGDSAESLAHDLFD